MPMMMRSSGSPIFMRCRLPIDLVPQPPRRKSDSDHEIGHSELNSYTRPHLRRSRHRVQTVRTDAVSARLFGLTPSDSGKAPEWLHLETSVAMRRSFGAQ